MLVIKIELWPFGHADQMREVGRIGIANATGHDSSDYVAVLTDDTGHHRSVLLTGHRRSDGFWPHLARAADSHTDAADRGPLDQDIGDLADRIRAHMHAPRP